MKKLERLKLNHLNESALDERQLNALKGACGCTCGNCGCGSWDSSGTLPPSQSQGDHGMGSVSGNLSGTVNHGI